MKKMLFFLALSASFLASSSAVFAMEQEGDREMLQTDPVRIRFSSRGLFRRNTSWIFAELKKEHFRVNSENEDDESARGRRELWIDDTEIKPLLDELRKAGMVIEEQKDYEEKVKAEVAAKLEEKVAERLSGNCDQNFDLGKKVGLKEAEERKSFFQRHPKKVIAGTVLVTAVGAGAFVHWWENK